MNRSKFTRCEETVLIFVSVFENRIGRFELVIPPCDRRNLGAPFLNCFHTEAVPFGFLFLDMSLECPDRLRIALMQPFTTILFEDIADSLGEQPKLLDGLVEKEMINGVVSSLLCAAGTNRGLGGCSSL